MSVAAHALSVSRALLAVPLVGALECGAAAAALAILLLAIVSDVLDGVLARRSVRPDGRFGAYLDVGADAVFLLSGLTTLWALGRMPAWLPIVAAAMLARFFATSPRATGPRYDPVGKHYGTLLYGVLAVWLLGAPEPVRHATLVAVAVATVASLVGRTRFLRGGGHGCPAGGEAMRRARARHGETGGAA